MRESSPPVTETSIDESGNVQNNDIDDTVFERMEDIRVDQRGSPETEIAGNGTFNMTLSPHELWEAAERKEKEKAEKHAAEAKQIEIAQKDEASQKEEEANGEKEEASKKAESEMISKDEDRNRELVYKDQENKKAQQDLAKEKAGKESANKQQAMREAQKEKVDKEIAREKESREKDRARRKAEIERGHKDEARQKEQKLKEDTALQEVTQKAQKERDNKEESSQKENVFKEESRVTAQKENTQKEEKRQMAERESAQKREGRQKARKEGAEKNEASLKAENERAKKSDDRQRAQKERTTKEESRQKVEKENTEKDTERKEEKGKKEKEKNEKTQRKEKKEKQEELQKREEERKSKPLEVRAKKTEYIDKQEHAEKRALIGSPPEKQEKTVKFGGFQKIGERMSEVHWPFQDEKNEHNDKFDAMAGSSEGRKEIMDANVQRKEGKGAAGGLMAAFKKQAQGEPELRLKNNEQERLWDRGHTSERGSRQQIAMSDVLQKLGHGTGEHSREIAQKTQDSTGYYAKIKEHYTKQKERTDLFRKASEHFAKADQVKNNPAKHEEEIAWATRHLKEEAQQKKDEAREKRENGEEVWVTSPNEFEDKRWHEFHAIAESNDKTSTIRRKLTEVGEKEGPTPQEKQDKEKTTKITESRAKLEVAHRSGSTEAREKVLEVPPFNKSVGGQMIGSGENVSFMVRWNGTESGNQRAGSGQIVSVAGRWNGTESGSHRAAEKEQQLAQEHIDLGTPTQMEIARGHLENAARERLSEVPATEAVQKKVARHVELDKHGEARDKQIHECQEKELDNCSNYDEDRIPTDLIDQASLTYHLLAADDHLVLADGKRLSSCHTLMQCATVLLAA